ncbi:MAG: type II secretion system protein [Planctomycetes bacterium]|nr:type II secretion system protein [Planctomycetota bacterium]
MARRRAFTLIELLVVITIIGILISLLFPVYGSIIHSVQEHQCQNNLNQLAKVMQAYCQQNDGCFPFVGYGSSIKPSAEDWLFVSRLGARPLTSTAGVVVDTYAALGDLQRGAFVRNKMVGKTDIFYCPTDLDQGLIRGPGNSRQHSCLRYRDPRTSAILPAATYVVNGSITYGDATIGTARRVRKVSEFSPSAFLFIEESSGDTNNGEPDSACNRAYMSPNDGTRRLTARHRGGGYIACMDASVIWMTTDEFEETRRWATGTDWYKFSPTTSDDARQAKRWNP